MKEEIIKRARSKYVSTLLSMDGRPYNNPLIKLGTSVTDESSTWDIGVGLILQELLELPNDKIKNKKEENV